ncbi:MAG: hypothetical protein AB1646_04710 [Thermodesulfobacteriota bacterium]
MMLRVTWSLMMIALLVGGCSKGPSPIIPSHEQAKLLEGTWTIKSRIGADGVEQPADDRQMRLTFTGTGLFKAQFRGDSGQQWISPGQGAFSYDPPWVTLYWDKGRITAITVLDKSPGTMKIRHGRNLVPGAGGEPDEVYVKEITADDKKP